MKEKIMFSKDHLCLTENNGTVRIGLTAYALKKMRSVVFVNLPDEGDNAVMGEAFGDIESLKTVSELISPVSGSIEAVNSSLADDPDSISEDMENSWLIEVKADSYDDELMTEEEYLKYTESEC